MALVNMQQSAEEAKEANTVTGESDDGPRYPYGLELRLDEEALGKLGITAPPAVGTTMTITAKVIVTSASQHQTQGGDPEYSSCWQITDMECGSSAGDKQVSAASQLYGGT
jgi:hypothetical protein